MNAENESVAKVVSWSRKDKLGWEAVSDSGQVYMSIDEIVGTLRSLVERELYPLAFVLLTKLRCDYDLEEVFEGFVVERVINPDPDTGIITGAIEEIIRIAEKKGIKRKIQI